MKNLKTLILAIAILSTISLNARSWADSVAIYGREVFMPAKNYHWGWAEAVMLNAYIHLYNNRPVSERQPNMEYVRTAMDAVYDKAQAVHPNSVASGVGMAFLARELEQKRYMDMSNRIMTQYMNIPRAANGGVSHRPNSIELWDDTIYMVGIYLLEMYRTTGEQRYLDMWMKEFITHREKLQDADTGMWVHGYDDDNENFDDKCSQNGWASMTPERRSIEYWGRGNGWIVISLADMLQQLPRESKYYSMLAQELRRMCRFVVPLQDSETGLWRQLPVHTQVKENYLESSCSAMFAYGMAVGIRLGVLEKDEFTAVIDKAYYGLRHHAMKREGKYLIPTHVCLGTCVGNADYYYKRPTGHGVDYGIGVYIMFGLEYERLKAQI